MTQSQGATEHANGYGERSGGLPRFLGVQRYVSRVLSYMWALLPILLPMIYCKADLLRVTTNQYVLEANTQASGEVVCASLERDTQADAWRNSYIFKYSIVDSGDFKLVIMIESLLYAYSAVKIDSITLNNEVGDWEMSLLSDKDATVTMFLSSSDDKEGSPADSAFYETGMKGNATDEMSLYSIPIPLESETVIARVSATLVTGDGVEQRGIWVLPMRQVRETKYMSHLLAYILGYT